MKNVLLCPREGGSANGIELALRFVLWAQQLQQPPTPVQIREHFHCSRAAAYRWRRAWHAATGTHMERNR